MSSAHQPLTIRPSPLNSAQGDFLARQRDDDFALRQGQAQGFGHPVEGRAIAMDEKDFAGTKFPGVFHQIPARGVAAEIKARHLTIQFHGRVGIGKLHRRSGLRSQDGAGGAVGRRVVAFFLF